MKMTYKEIASMIAEVGIPYAYYQFPEDTIEGPPFICFYYPKDANFDADNTPYAPATALTIELYTDEKDFELESTLEGVLISHGLNFDKSETYLDSEKMQMEIYETEILIDNTPETPTEVEQTNGEQS